MTSIERSEVRGRAHRPRSHSRPAYPLAVCVTVITLAVQGCSARVVEEGVPQSPDIRPLEIHIPGEARPRPPNVDDAPVFTHYTVPPKLMNRAHVRTQLDSVYLPLLRSAGIGGSAVVWMLIDESGKLVKSQIRRSSGSDELDAAAIRLTKEMKFKPAEDHGEIVKVWVALPIVFEPNGSEKKTLQVNIRPVARAIGRNAFRQEAGK